VKREVPNAARSVWRIAHVLGIDSASTKNTMTLTTNPISAPQAPNRSTATIVTSVA
jgi:hypothetical protein